MPRSHTPGMTRAHRMNCWTVRFPRAFSGEKTSLPGLLAMKTLLCALCSYTTPRASFLRLRAVSLHVPGYDRGPAIVALGRRGRRGSGGTTCTRLRLTGAGGCGKNLRAPGHSRRENQGTGLERKCLRSRVLTSRGSADLRNRRGTRRHK